LYLLWVLVLTGAATIVITGYLFWQHLFGYFPGISDMPVYFVLTTAIMLFMFLGIDIVRTHKRQMDTMSFPEILQQ